jgi:betaine-aldehyde dehydrogenase
MLMIDPQHALLPKKPRHFELLIDGVWRPAQGPNVIERASPAHEVPVTTYPAGTAGDAEAAIMAARRAFDAGTWPKLKASERSRVLLRAADLIEHRAEELALLDTLEGGKPLAQARGEIAAAADIWRYAAALARNVHGDAYANLGEAMLGVVVREPMGVVTIITPWNFPFLIVSQKLPFALAAGCTAVVKPSELTSGSTLVLGEILLEAGLPPGAANIVTGTGRDVGATMVRHPAVDMISFTGSTAVGKMALVTAAETLKRVSMELGGKIPQLVFADADLVPALDAVLFGVYFNAGECCNSGSRLLVQRGIAETFVAEIVARSRDLPVGDPLDERTKVGAIISSEHLGKIESFVAGAADVGAEIRLGGQRLATERGQFMAPTVVAGVTPEMAIAREEVFGPVLSVLTFDTVDEAISLANATSYGLSAGVWSRDYDTCQRAARGIRAGTVWLNTFMDGYAELPFGGFGESGIGRELGRHAVLDYTEVKTVQMHNGPRTAWWLPSPEST